MVEQTIVPHSSQASICFQGEMDWTRPMIGLIGVYPLDDAQLLEVENGLLPLNCLVGARYQSPDLAAG